MLADDEFRFCVYEIPLVTATFAVEEKAVRKNNVETWLAEHADEPTHPMMPGLAERDETHWYWLQPQHPLLQQDDQRSLKAEQLIMLRMEQAIHQSGSQFIGLQESKSILNWLESEQPELAQELQRIMPLSRFAAVLQRLASERIPLRSVRTIAETLIEHGQHERESTALADFVRIALKEHICHQYLQPNGLDVWLLTPETEELLRDSLRQTQSETFFSLAHEYGISMLHQMRQAFPAYNNTQALILVAQDLRSPLRGLLKDEFHAVPVLSFAELTSNIAINVLGRFDLQQSPPDLQEDDSCMNYEY